jgi:hypothetical protein
MADGKSEKRNVDVIIQNENAAIDRLNNIIMAILSGVLTLSLSPVFFKKDSMSYCSFGFLVSCWVILVFAIILNMYSFYRSIKVNRETLEDEDKNLSYKEKSSKYQETNKRRLRIIRIKIYLTAAAMISFLASMAFSVYPK